MTIRQLFDRVNGLRWCVIQAGAVVADFPDFQSAQQWANFLEN